MSFHGECIDDLGCRALALLRSGVPGWHRHEKTRETRLRVISSSSSYFITDQIPISSSHYHTSLILIFCQLLLFFDSPPPYLTTLTYTQWRLLLHPYSPHPRSRWVNVATAAAFTTWEAILTNNLQCRLPVLSRTSRWSRQ